jgi:hypothetical protein
MPVKKSAFFIYIPNINLVLCKKREVPESYLFFKPRLFGAGNSKSGFAGAANYQVATLPRLCYKPTSISFQVFDFSGNFAEFRVIEEY